MNAWAGDFGDLKLRSAALPRDGGVLNPSTKGKYGLDSTNVARTLERERKRLRLLAEQAPAPGTSVVALRTKERP